VRLRLLSFSNCCIALPISTPLANLSVVAQHQYSPGTGAAPVPVNSLYKTAKEYEFVISNSGAKLVICDQARHDVIGPICGTTKNNEFDFFLDLEING
jgi:hypothetical protein